MLNFGDDIECNETICYHKAVGSLLYLANGTRHDILFSVNHCSCKQSNFTKWILRYLQGTKTYRLLYTGVENGIDVYLDKSLGTREDGSSINDFVIKVFSDVIHWKTKK